MKEIWVQIPTGYVLAYDGEILMSLLQQGYSIAYTLEDKGVDGIEVDEHIPGSFTG